MVSEKEIWDDFRLGKSYALSYIYYKYVQQLFGYGKKFSNDEDLIKDSIQDLFFELIRTRNSLGETDSIKFYLLRSFRRKLVSNHKKQNSFFVQADEGKWQPEIILSAEHHYIEQEKQSHQLDALKNALKKLSPKQREILYYRYTCEFDYDQVCEIMAIKYDSARKQVFRAIKVLRQALSETGNLNLFLFFLTKK
jgi:RNA polymerase sigma factor (sigma-70 family)